MPIQFPSRDLTNQYISLSYQDVVQRYSNGSSQYFLDGNGYSIGVIPSASLGNTILTSDQTASYSIFALSALSASYAPGNPAISASYALSSSHAEQSTFALIADVALLADTASVAANADFATTASWASHSFTADSSSWASHAFTAESASWALESVFAETASWAPQQQDITVNSITTSFFSGSGEVIVPYPIHPNDAVTKEYVDNINPQGLQAYLRADPSDLPSYYQMHDLSFPLSASAITISTASVTTNEYAFVFASDAIGVTNIDFGSFPVHFHAWFTGAGNASLSVAPEFWLWSASVETFVADERPIVLNKTVDASYVADITLTASIVTNPTDRALLKFRVTSQNQNPTMFMNVDGKTSAGIIIPVPASNFVLRAGDKMTGDLTAPGFSGSLFGTASWAVNAINGGTQLVTASTYPITASWAETSSWAINAINGGTQLITGSDYPITSSWSDNASLVSVLPTNAAGNLFVTFVSSSGAQQLYIDTSSVYYHPASDTLFANRMSASVVTASNFYGTASVAITASHAVAALSASWAQTSSFSIFSVVQITQSFSSIANVASQSFYATSSGFATQSIFATQSLFATQSISASYAPVDPVYSASVSTQFGTKQDNLVVGGTYPITASWAVNAINGGTQLVTASTYPITASWANNSVNSNNAQTASFAVTSSYLIYPSATVTVVSASTLSLVSISNNIYNSIFVAYVLNDLQNFRAGNVVVLYNTQSAVLSEASTTDLGDSSGLTFSASLSASSVNLLAINGSARNYSVKYHYDVL